MAARRPRPRGAPVIERVLRCALAELGRVGLGRLSVPAVARRAGVNKTSVYRRWPTKEDLVRAALRQSLRHAEDVPDLGSLELELLELARRVAGFLASPEGAAVTRLLFLGEAGRLRALVQRSWAGAGLGGATAVAARAHARGELAGGDEGQLLFFSIAGALLHRHLIEGATIDDHWLRRLIRFHLRGARPTRGDRRFLAR